MTQPAPDSDKTHIRSSTVARLGAVLASATLRRPSVPVVAVVLLVVVAGKLAAGVAFDTRFDALLPDDDPVVQEARELQKRAGGTVELVIAVRGDDAEHRLVYARDLVRRLKDKPWIRRADVEFPVDFFLDRRMWLAPLATLTKLKEDIEEEVQRAKARANPLYVDLEDDEEPKEKPWASVDRQYGVKDDSALLKKTFTSPDNKYLFVRVKPMGNSIDMSLGARLLADIEAVVAAANPKKYKVSIRYAGSLISNQVQNRTMTADFRAASVIALVGILLLMTLYIRRLTAPLVIAVPLVAGVLSTVAFTALTFGQFNLVTGFLVSVLFGLGIDFEIHLYLRYLELLPPGADLRRRKEAMIQAVVATLPGCATAALTTASAFFALTISDFRGYREYGSIAGAGVLITLVTTFTFLPPLAVLLTRKGSKARSGRSRGGLSPRLAAAMVAVGTAVLIFSLVMLPGVQVQSNFAKLKGDSPELDFSEWVSDQLGGSLSPAAVLVQTTEQARQVEKYLEPKVKDPDYPIKSHVSLAAMVPAHPVKKEKIIKEIEAILADVADEELKEEDREKVEDGLRMARTKPWGIKQVPDVFLKRFLTVDGGGQFVVLWPRLSMHIDREVIAWGRQLEKVRADLRAMGIPVRILDQNRVAAAVLGQMAEDAPKVVGYAALAVLLFLILDFRNPRQVVLVAGSLGLGVTWMLGMLALTEVTINVFNQAMLPTILGVGIDNAVHIKHRYLQEGVGSIARVVSTTGSAALLASATTAIGFGSAITAHHLGIRTLGQLSVIGVCCTFVSCTIFLPALLRLLEGKKKQ